MCRGPTRGKKLFYWVNPCIAGSRVRGGAIPGIEGALGIFKPRKCPFTGKWTGGEQNRVQRLRTTAILPGKRTERSLNLVQLNRSSQQIGCTYSEGHLLTYKVQPKTRPAVSEKNIEPASKSMKNKEVSFVKLRSGRTLIDLKKSLDEEQITIYAKKKGGKTAEPTCS